MPRQSSVSAAYSPVGGKKPSSLSSGCTRFAYSLLITMVLCIVVMFPSNKKQSPKEEFQIGQAHQNYTTATPNSKVPSSTKSIHSMVTDSESVEMVLEDARKEIKLTEKEQLDQLEKTVDTTTTSITNKLRIGMGRLFGSTLSSEEVEAVATQVQEKLTSEAKTNLRGKADQLTNIEIKKIETMASSEGRNGYGVTEIEEDVYDDERKAVSSIKLGINAEAKNVQQSLSARAAEIEKAILEERLSAKLGKRVKLVIEENEVAPMDGDDELFQGITALTKPSSATNGSTVLPSGSSATRPTVTTTTTTTKGAATSTTTTKFPSTSSSKNTTKTTDGFATTSAKSPASGSTSSTNTTSAVNATGTPVGTTKATVPTTLAKASGDTKAKVVPDKKDGKKNGKKDRKKKGKIP